MNGLHKYTVGIVFLLTHVCALSLSAEPSETLLQEVFEKRFYVEFEKEKLSGKECEKLGKVDGKDEHTTIKYDGYVYSLDLKNRSDIDLKKLYVRCRFYYEEEKIWKVNSSDHQTAVKYLDFSFYIPTLPAGTGITTNTTPFILFSRKLPSGWYYDNDMAEIIESEPKGFWMRISQKMPDGHKIYRDFCDPKSLPSRIDW